MNPSCSFNLDIGLQLEYTPSVHNLLGLCQKLEIGKCIDLWSFRKSTLQYLDPVSFADVSIFFAKKDFLVKFSVFFRKKVSLIQNLRATGYVSQIQFPDYSKLVIYYKSNNDDKLSTRRHRQTLLTLSYFFHQVQLLVQVSRQQFSSYDNFCLQEI